MSTPERDQFQLKKLTPNAIPKSIERAEQYRLLNEPELAESICLDVLEVDSSNERALIILLLAVTDQFVTSEAAKIHQAKELLQRLPDAYRRAYYAGIISEREGRACLRRGAPGAGYAAHACLRGAMEHYEAAERIRPAGTDEALLRWNTCARTIMSARLEAAPADDTPYMSE